MIQRKGSNEGLARSIGKSASKRKCAALAATLASFLLSGRSQATTYTYTPVNGANDTWSTGVDWSATPVSGNSTQLNFASTSFTFPSNTDFTDTNTDNVAGAFNLNILDLNGTGEGSQPGHTAAVNIARNTNDSLNFAGSSAAINLSASNSSKQTVTYNFSIPISLGTNVTMDDTGSAAFNFTGNISGSGTLTESGAGTGLKLTNSIVGGSVYINGTASSSSVVTVGNGSANSGTLAGSGTMGGSVTVANGGTIGAGANSTSNGKFTTGAETWNGGGKFAVKIDTSGANLGAGSGFDQLVLSTLSIGATSGNKFTIAISSLAGASGTAFNGHNNYSWIIGATSGAVTGFNTNVFSLDTSGFSGTNYVSSSNNTSSSGLFSLSEAANGSGENFTLSYTAAPEPTSLLLLGVALGPLAIARRRRRVISPMAEE